MKAALFLTSIVRVALNRMAMPSSDAERLLMGTAAQESEGFKYVRQTGGGPALGYFQMEPATHDDCWTNYILFKPQLKSAVVACLVPNVIPPGAKMPHASLLLTNNIYAAAMARVKYLRAPGAIPHTGLALAHYWKDNYNTKFGAGTVEQFRASWNTYLAGVLYERI